MVLQLSDTVSPVNSSVALNPVPTGFLPAIANPFVLSELALELANKSLAVAKLGAVDQFVPSYENSED